MSCSYQLIVVIGYELVSYLLFYSSARCVTFKEPFVCKSSTLMAYIEIKLQLLSSMTSFSVKENLGAGTSSINRRPCSYYCISIEKDFASRLNHVKTMMQGPFLAYAIDTLVNVPVGSPKFRIIVLFISVDTCKFQRINQIYFI